MTDVTFYAVDAPGGAIELAGEMAHAWWVREGNRIYLPANALGEEWLVRHEMLHALLQRGTHPSSIFVHDCHVASAAVFRDSSLTADPGKSARPLAFPGGPCFAAFTVAVSTASPWLSSGCIRQIFWHFAGATRHEGTLS